MMKNILTYRSVKIGDKDKERFYYEISMLLHSGIDLKNALNIFMNGLKNRPLNVLFGNLLQFLVNGGSLAEAMKQSKCFTDYEICCMQIGEECSRLSVVMSELSIFYKDKIAFKKKIISSVSYPVVVMITSFIAVLFMLQFVVPMFADVFKRMGGKLPFLTRCVIRISEISGDLFLGGLVLIAIFIIWIYYIKDYPVARRKWGNFILGIPLLGMWIKSIHLSRLFMLMKVMLSAEVSLQRSMLLASDTISFMPLRDIWAQSISKIQKGVSLYESLRESEFIDSQTIAMIQAGEEVNRLFFVFEKISEQKKQYLDHVSATLFSIMEPLMILFVGGMVAVILLSMYLPLFELGQNFH